MGSMFSPQIISKAHIRLTLDMVITLVCWSQYWEEELGGRSLKAIRNFNHASSFGLNLRLILFLSNSQIGNFSFWKWLKAKKWLAKKILSLRLGALRMFKTWLLTLRFLTVKIEWTGSSILKEIRRHNKKKLSRLT